MGSTHAHVLDEVHAPASEQARDGARTAALRLAEPATVMVVRQKDGSEYVVPSEVQRAVLTLLNAGADGQAVFIVSHDARISPQKAAEWLGVSRPFVYRLIERGDLPARRVGTHYRLHVADVLALADRRDVLATSVDVAMDDVLNSPSPGRPTAHRRSGRS